MASNDGAASCAVNNYLEKLVGCPEAYSFKQVLRILFTSGFNTEDLLSHYVLQLGFSGSDVKKIEYIAPDKILIEQTVLSLYGVVGVMPDYIIELLYRRSKLNDSALCEFLNIFNQRLLQIMSDSWRQTQFMLNIELQQMDAVQGVLQSMHGLQLNAAEDTDLYFANMQNKNALAVSDLSKWLNYYFDLPMQIISGCGKAHAIPFIEQSQLGRQ